MGHLNKTMWKSESVENKILAVPWEILPFKDLLQRID